MLWNWNTIDSCFLSSSWRTKTSAMFAGSVVGVFFLCMAIELLRRAAREYDRRITAARVAEKGVVAAAQPTLGQHAVRSLFYGVQFTAAFLV
jgi:copper transporter 1